MCPRPAVPRASLSPATGALDGALDIRQPLLGSRVQMGMCVWPGQLVPRKEPVGPVCRWLGAAARHLPPRPRRASVQGSGQGGERPWRPHLRPVCPSCLGFPGWQMMQWTSPPKGLLGDGPLLLLPCVTGESPRHHCHRACPCSAESPPGPFRLQESLGSKLARIWRAVTCGSGEDSGGHCLRLGVRAPRASRNPRDCILQGSL